MTFNKNFLKKKVEFYVLQTLCAGQMGKAQICNGRNIIFIKTK